MRTAGWEYGMLFGIKSGDQGELGVTSVTTIKSAQNQFCLPFLDEQREKTKNDFVEATTLYKPNEF